MPPRAHLGSPASASLSPEPLAGGRSTVGLARPGSAGSPRTAAARLPGPQPCPPRRHGRPRLAARAQGGEEGERARSRAPSPRPQGRAGGGEPEPRPVPGAAAVALGARPGAPAPALRAGAAGRRRSPQGLCPPQAAPHACAPPARGWSRELRSFALSRSGAGAYLLPGTCRRPARPCPAAGQGPRHLVPGGRRMRRLCCARPGMEPVSWAAPAARTILFRELRGPWRLLAPSQQSRRPRRPQRACPAGPRNTGLRAAPRPPSARTSGIWKAPGASPLLPPDRAPAQRLLPRTQESSPSPPPSDPRVQALNARSSRTPPLFSLSLPPPQAWLCSRLGRQGALPPPAGISWEHLSRPGVAFW